jgi:magnesium transporter
MKVLTAITFVMAVPTMVFSFYGMNVHLPMAASWIFPSGLTAILCVIVAAVLFRKGFFSE